ncbi:SDR family oxidoreductase [Actinoplanes derwentensis]|uniref:NAD(P)-dependent dehydrogenase, short-chain alcohol dehydrogenase family n=1 Tax=Actinoplanes derwentensis TaxID=113562 RepID=A0A1H1Z070_9ACTN|nr:SDR family oxidoreductase [Actinoplanes derwentensis]GID81369.1 short-chain dehydrogenase/reductas [Actinoplanes derwentensis]SDT27134.1 NAD(P)-dependent dehydrogenase, short-chain alcohol dehydrogenase family [Actinoplanes derwentensis]
MSPTDVVVVTGAGGMGAAVARRIGSGRTVILADAFPDHLDRAVSALRAEGYDARGQVTDIADQKSVNELAALASAEGRLSAVVHTAGVSAATSTVQKIMEVDLAGTAYLIAAFEPVVTRATSVVCVASMAGHYAQLSPDVEQALALTPAEELLSLEVVTGFDGNSVSAYILAKRANQVRVQAAALTYNRRGARINTISPGVVATPMAQAEQESSSGDHMMAMLDACGAGRTGTPGEVAEAVAFLTGPGSLYITGTDLLIDGGQAAWLRRHRPQ